MYLFYRQLVIFYTNWLIPGKFSAMTYGPFIFIRPTRKGDAGLVAHEQTHVKQFWRNPLFGLWYLFSKKARLGYELEAYKAQLPHDPSRLNALAEALANRYGLGLSVGDAKRMINGD